jgi:hypothetical protein
MRKVARKRSQRLKLNLHQLIHKDLLPTLKADLPLLSKHPPLTLRELLLQLNRHHLPTLKEDLSQSNRPLIPRRPLLLPNRPQLNKLLFLLNRHQLFQLNKLQLLHRNKLKLPLLSRTPLLLMNKLTLCHPNKLPLLLLNRPPLPQSNNQLSSQLNSQHLSILRKALPRWKYLLMLKEALLQSSRSLLPLLRAALFKLNKHLLPTMVKEALLPLSSRHLPLTKVNLNQHLQLKFLRSRLNQRRQVSFPSSIDWVWRLVKPFSKGLDFMISVNLSL